MGKSKMKQRGQGASKQQQKAAAEEKALKKLNMTSSMSTPSLSSSSSSQEVADEHLPPFPLVVTVLVCSGMMWMFAFRDVFATGRVIAGSSDLAMQLFTKSIAFFDDSKGWKSTQGGLSSIMAVTTDENDMGGLFVRKLAGAASLAIQTQKLMPMLFHPSNARWDLGHFKPTIWLCFFANLASTAFYASYMEDFVAAGADGLPKLMMAALLFESIVMLGYLVTNKVTKRAPATKMTEGKTPSSLPSQIVSRTVALVSALVALIAGRDLMRPGEAIDFIPRDDIYLEWTGAFIHSPPDGSVESDEYGMMAELHIGEKYLSQFLAMNLLVLCAIKVTAGFAIRYGSDGSGTTKSAMIWKAQAIGSALVLMVFRLFSSAAMSASLDLRWHLMCLGYETLVLGLYGFF